MKRLVLSLLFVASFGSLIAVEDVAKDAKKTQIDQIQKDIDAKTAEYLDLQAKAAANKQDPKMQNSTIQKAQELQGLQAKLEELKK